MFQCPIPGAKPTLGCRQAVRHQTLTLAFVGSNPAIPARFDPLAQLAEQLPFKQWVRGSNPRRVTKKRKMHSHLPLFDFLSGFEKLNATVRWTVACRQLDGSNTLIFFRPKRKKMQTNPRRVTENPPGTIMFYIVFIDVCFRSIFFAAAAFSSIMRN